MRIWPEIISWLQRNRTSVRLGFMLRIASMALGAFFSLFMGGVCCSMRWAIICWGCFKIFRR